MIQLIRGFRDILPGEVERWQQIEKTAAKLFGDFGFREIRPPIMERAELFARSIGEDTDIVEKEMYTLPDSRNEFITLRPEATASVVRAYIQHKLYAVDPIQKLYTIGPMFRRERPQKGRYRQFYQINAEVFGVEAPFIDAQLIFMLVTLFERIKVSDVQAHINSLGCPACRPDFKAALAGTLTAAADRLCADCRRRSDRNPLRVLDCKVPACREAVADAPSIIDYLCPDCRRHFDAVQDGLQRLNIPFVVNKRLVRGLDYYTRTTFEIQTGALGAQNAVAGGGRYDGLIKALGGPEQPAIGFAIGLDRLAEISRLDERDLTPVPDVFVAALGEQSVAAALEWASALSLSGVRVEADFTDRGLKGQMKRADRLNARYVLIAGEQELAAGAVVLRNMATRDQALIPVDRLVEKVAAIVAE